MTTYNAAAQRVDGPEHDHSHLGQASSPPSSVSPCLSSSPMPFLPSIGTAFTPLSMDSSEDNHLSKLFSPDTDADEEDVSRVRENQENLPSAQLGTSTASTTNSGINLGTITQSLASARATMTAEENIEYDLLSSNPGDASTNFSPSPNLADDANNFSSRPADPEDQVGDETAGDQHRHHKKVLGRLPTPNILATPRRRDPQQATADPQEDRDRFPGQPEGAISTKGEGTASPDSQADENRPSTSSSQPQILRPEPVPPLTRTASTRGVAIRHPAPDLNTRTNSYASNIAQLEATAERLSMTSSIEDAIRDLHDEQKRNDSRRSSILAATTGVTPESAAPIPFPRQVSSLSSSSILETNSAARQGGYSPAGYVMSPNHSLLSTSTRLRSGSTRSRSDADNEEYLSRNGPGKGSTRSVVTNNNGLGDIAEVEPTSLTQAAMNEADNLMEEEPVEDQEVRLPQADFSIPYTDDYDTMRARNYWDEATAEIDQEQQRQQAQERDQRRTGSAESRDTYDHIDNAFADFDGAHCSPDVDLLDQEPQFPQPRTVRPRPPTMMRPQSYMDPLTGQQMLYYPAKVPAMLNLPQKLSSKPKAAVRNMRRSQVLDAMPEASQQSANWLPEFANDPMNPFGVDLLESTSPAKDSSNLPEGDRSVPPAPHVSEDYPEPQTRTDARPVNPETRKSRMSIAGLPPQLRASAFFDMPSESPQIEVKDGSAMATLDSILDASAGAPVSAFTDHAFAGKLGEEVYGNDTKRKSRMKRNSTATMLDTKKRSTIMHVRNKSSGFFSLGRGSGERSNTISGPAALHNDNLDDADAERQTLSESIDGQLKPEAEAEVDAEVEAEEGEEEEGSEDEEPLYHGPPTTLLAELQIRKQQAKLRTRPAARAFPNGMHSTLLELDAVADIERKARKGKRVQLAWEAPTAANESDDEEVPLGLLYVSKLNGGDGNMMAAAAEVNRPLGLMERRQLEDNEPLSMRRNRLQGKETPMAARSTLDVLKSRSALNLPITYGMKQPSGSPQLLSPAHVRSPLTNSNSNSNISLVQEKAEAEVEGETLGERKRRLKAKEESELPKARPVSTSFSVELLSQLGDTFKDEEAEAEKSNVTNGKENKKPEEEEETLGQRRRRLQAERERAGTALDMHTRIPSNNLNGPTLHKKLSMADVLGAHPLKVSNPMVEAERVKQEEAARFAREQEQKMAAMRAQMPQSVSIPNLQKSGAYGGGRFNDGTGGGVGVPADYRPPQQRAASGYGMMGQVPMQTPQMGAGMMGNGYQNPAMMQGYGMNAMGGYGVPAGAYGMPMTNAYGMPMQMPMQQQPHADMIERWRQSVMP